MSAFQQLLVLYVQKIENIQNDLFRMFSFNDHKKFSSSFGSLASIFYHFSFLQNLIKTNSNPKNGYVSTCSILMATGKKNLNLVMTIRDTHTLYMVCSYFYKFSAQEYFPLLRIHN